MQEIIGKHEHGKWSMGRRAPPMNNKPLPRREIEMSEDFAIFGVCGGRTNRNEFTSNRPRIISDELTNISNTDFVMRPTNNNQFSDDGSGCIKSPAMNEEASDTDTKKRRHRPRGCRGRGSRRNRSLRRAAAQAAASQQLTEPMDESYDKELVDFLEKDYEFRGHDFNADIIHNIHANNNPISNYDSMPCFGDYQNSVQSSNQHHSDRRRQLTSRSQQNSVRFQLTSNSSSSTSIGVVSSSSSSERSILVSVSSSFESEENKAQVSEARLASHYSWATCNQTQGNFFGGSPHVWMSSTNMEGNNTGNTTHSSFITQVYEPFPNDVRFESSIQDKFYWHSQSSIQNIVQDNPRINFTANGQTSQLDAASITTKIQRVNEYYPLSGITYTASNPQTTLYHGRESSDTKVRKHRENEGSFFSTSPKSFLRGEKKKRRTIDSKQMDDILTELREVKSTDIPRDSSGGEQFLGGTRTYCWF